ncbi:MAG: inorganic phosphate transporter [Planctomycetota bacterium]|nr:inorganic phosphate transporter [Planctomycetota bacterium]
MSLVLLTFVGFWLAYSNGANDNFKGVATLFGSNTLGFRQALGLAALATLAGGVASCFLGGMLVQTFNGTGLVPSAWVGSPELLVSVGAASAATILLATWLGMPTSTTHAITGGLLGAGLSLPEGRFSWTPLAKGFAVPLLVSPLLAIALTVIVYAMLHSLRSKLGISRETCVCLVDESRQLATAPNTRAAQQTAGAIPGIQVGQTAACAEIYRGRCIGVDAQTVVSAIHCASGAALCFARALNDTPKIAALLLIAGSELGWGAWGLVVGAMCAGGLLNARKVALTMSKRITELNPGQGLTASLTTASLVLGASYMGVPVSTTHVSCGSIFGIGVSRGQGRWKTVMQILAAWLLTLPLAALLGAIAFSLVRSW